MVVIMVLVVIVELGALHPRWLLSTHLHACFRYEMTFRLMVVLSHLLARVDERILPLAD